MRSDRRRTFAKVQQPRHKLDSTYFYVRKWKKQRQTEREWDWDMTVQTYHTSQKNVQSMHFICHRSQLNCSIHYTSHTTHRYVQSIHSVQDCVPSNDSESLLNNIFNTAPPQNACT